MKKPAPSLPSQPHPTPLCWASDITRTPDISFDGFSYLSHTHLFPIFKLRRVRELLKFSQKKEPDVWGPTQAAYSQMEKAPDKLRKDTLEKIAQVKICLQVRLLFDMPDKN